jgi:uncharacterized membrane protein
MPFLHTASLVHPETMSAERIRHPFRVGARNAAVALLGIAVGGIAQLIRVLLGGGGVASWVWPVAVVGLIVVCFAHAYLGALIGGRRANNVALVLLLAVLLGMIIWVTRVADTRGG